MSLLTPFVMKFPNAEFDVIPIFVASKYNFVSSGSFDLFLCEEIDFSNHLPYLSVTH